MNKSKTATRGGNGPAPAKTPAALLTQLSRLGFSQHGPGGYFLPLGSGLELWCDDGEGGTPGASVHLYVEKASCGNRLPTGQMGAKFAAKVLSALPAPAALPPSDLLADLTDYVRRMAVNALPGSSGAAREEAGKLFARVLAAPVGISAAIVAEVAADESSEIARAHHALSEALENPDALNALQNRAQASLAIVEAVAWSAEPLALLTAEARKLVPECPARFGGAAQQAAFESRGV